MSKDIKEIFQYALVIPGILGFFWIMVDLGRYRNSIEHDEEMYRLEVQEMEASAQMAFSDALIDLNRTLLILKEKLDD